VSRWAEVIASTTRQRAIARRRLNVLGTKQSRTSCFDTMAADVPRLRELYCKDDSAQRDTDACVLLDKIQVDLLRLDAQRLFERGDKLGIADGQPLFDVVYLMLVTDAERTHRVSPLAAKAMCRVGTGYQAMGLYEEAADWYERFAAWPARGGSSRTTGANSTRSTSSFHRLRPPPGPRSALLRPDPPLRAPLLPPDR
jgi:hypothetical protein